jgi:hypothetical protein
MELTLQSLTPRCHLSGRDFAEGERVVSFLVRDAAQGGAVLRYDVAEVAQADFMAPGPVACRWVQLFKARKAEDNAERTLKLTAETLFLALSDPANERTMENERLLHSAQHSALSAPPSQCPARRVRRKLGARRRAQGPRSSLYKK